MHNTHSLILRRLITAALSLCSAVAASSAFATCGRHCDENPTLDRIDVIGWYNPYDVEEQCSGGECDWEWEAPPDNGDNGGGAETFPYISEPAPDVHEPFDGRCGTSTIGIDQEFGGGTVTFRICRENGEWRVDMCNDNPEWGSWGQTCP